MNNNTYRHQGSINEFYLGMDMRQSTLLFVLKHKYSLFNLTVLVLYSDSLIVLLFN